MSTKKRHRFTVATAVAEYHAVGERIAPQRVDLLRRWRAKGSKPDEAIRGRSSFDEVVVGTWLHVEAMGSGQVWCRIGPLTIWATKRGECIGLRVSREPSEHACEVTVDGDITQDRVTDFDRRLRALAAYETARGWDRRRAPDPERLRRELRKVLP